MVVLIPTPPQRGDFYIDSETDYHIYEKAVRANGKSDFENKFALAAAKAKDKARRNMIRAVRKAHYEATGTELRNVPTYYTRSVDGVDNAPDSAIKL